MVDMSTFEVLEAYAMLRREIGLIRATELKNHGFSYKQMMILFRLSSADATMGDLADFTMSDKASTTRAVETMEQAGLIKRVSDPHDRRKVIVALTPKGKLKSVKALEIRDHIGKRVNESLTLNERRELSRLLRKVVGGLQENRT